MQFPERAISDQAGRLRRFFEAMQKLPPPNDHENRAHASLERFFAEFVQYKPLIAAQSNLKEIERKVYRIDSARLTVFLGDFGQRFKRIRKNGASIAFWDVCGLKRNELRTASVLAWLFNPTQTHGRGSAILHAFIRRMKEHHKDNSFPRRCKLPAVIPSLWNPILLATWIAAWMF
jgi:hypothetical protein